MLNWIALSHCGWLSRCEVVVNVWHVVHSEGQSQIPISSGITSTYIDGRKEKKSEGINIQRTPIVPN
jgi:hypothetical protein